MIADKDRSGWIGASDTDKVIGSWKSQSWLDWWLQKVGINQDHFENKYTLAGTYWEHRILDAIGITQRDKQVLIPQLRLRVNLDGNTDDCIYEIKTYKLEKGFKLPKKYINQVQVQMFATGMRKAKIIAYGLTDKDYDNYFGELDKSRLLEFEIEYDPKWVDEVYLPKLMVLAHHLKKGLCPEEAQWK